MKMKKSDITWASIIPLIGGQSIGVMNFLDDKLPEYVLTYPAFAKNDSHFYNYLRTRRDWTDEPIVIDSKTNVLMNSNDAKRMKYVDIVNVVPPCAGLSGMSTISGGGCPANDWMYLSSEFVLKNIKPKVMFGENAPRLATNGGKQVRDRLFAIAKKYGYSVAFYKTSSVLHGLCQNRPRTFFFLFKSEFAPLLKYFKHEMVPFVDQIGPALDPNDKMACFVGKRGQPIIPTQDVHYKYLLEEIMHMSHPEFIAQLGANTKVIDLIAKLDGGFHKFIKWCAKNNMDKEQTRAEFAQAKMDSKMGFWQHGLLATPLSGPAQAFVSDAPWASIHPTEDRCLSIREGLRMMGLPDDFELLGAPRNANHMCQNVPVPTAYDMTDIAAAFVLDQLQCSGSDRIMVDNFKQVTTSESVMSPSTLEDFLSN